jgi:dihydrofolate reductase
LIREKKLIDEFYLFVNPIVMGSGKTIFGDLKEIQKLTLIDSKVFDFGLVLLHYEVKKLFKDGQRPDRQAIGVS